MGLRNLICTLGLAQHLASRGDVLKSTTAGPDGSYRFDGFCEGVYTLRVTADGFAYQETDVAVGEELRS